MAAFSLALAGIFLLAPELRWVRDSVPTPQAVAVIRALELAGLKGLEPRDYGGLAWEDRLASLQTLAAQRAFDAALTAAAEQYVSDLSRGRIDPRRVGAALERPEPFDVHAFVRSLAFSEDVVAALRAIETSFPAYHRMLAALRDYSEMARSAEAAPLSACRIVNPGDRWTDAARLQVRLALLGDLRAPHAAEDRYDGPLVDAVRRFQERHGLVADGRIGPRTLQALNVPIAWRVIQLQLALERLRWLPHQFPAPPIVVNIPEYMLRAYGPPGVLSMRVVVGTAFEHPTPVFVSALSGVAFRPAWNVPSSIERDELAGEFERDPAAMSRLGFEALDALGRTVPPVEAIARLKSGELRLRQKPGRRNALGLVKFDLPNPYGIYLHGTPAQRLFASERRDFSHGCIRLEDAFALAARVLDWPPSRVRAAMEGKRSFTAAPAVHFPVLILYSTAVVREDGTVEFFEDVYGEDAALERALEQRGTQRGSPAEGSPNTSEGRSIEARSSRDQALNSSLPAFLSIEPLMETLWGFNSGFLAAKIVAKAAVELGPDARITTQVLSRHPAAALEELARDHDIELVVVGSHGLNPVERALLGSTASRLIRTCRKPVVVIPAAVWGAAGSHSP